MSQNALTPSSVLSEMDPAIVLNALHASMGQDGPDSQAAIDSVGRAFDKAGIDCGPVGCKVGFIKRQIMNYAGEVTIRQLHQAASQTH